MPLKDNESLRQVRTFLSGLTISQKVLLGSSAVVVTGIVWLFVSLIDKDSYKTLYSGLSPGEAQTLSQQLGAENVASQVSPDGTTLSVPANQVDRVRLEFASKGLPQTGRQGFELFDKPNWAGSDFAEKVNYQRALEAELERTINSIHDVEACRVHLVLPRESLFTEREREAKAAVLVKLRGRPLSDETLNSVAYMVASSVDNLRPENVTIIDAAGHIPLLTRRPGPGETFRATTELEKGLTEKLLSTLAPVVGPDHVRASVTVEYDTSSSESTQENYDPKGSVMLTSQMTSEQGAGAENAEGVPGTDSNVPQAESQIPPKDQAGAQKAKVASAESADAGSVAENTEDAGAPEGIQTESKTYAVSKTVRHIVQPPGTIKRLYASLVVDDAVETTTENGQSKETRRKRSAEEIKQIQELASASLGIDPQRGDRLTVHDISFAGSALTSPTAPNLLDRVLPIINQWNGVLRYVGLGFLFFLVYVLVLRPVKKQVVVTLHNLPQRLGRAGAAEHALPAVSMPAPDEAASQPTQMQAPPPALSEGRAEALRLASLKNTLLERITKEPQEAGRLIQDWVEHSGG